MSSHLFNFNQQIQVKNEKNSLLKFDDNFSSHFKDVHKPENCSLEEKLIAVHCIQKKSCVSEKLTVCICWKILFISP